MERLGLKANTALLVTDFLSRKYFSGVVVDEGYLVITQNGMAYFTDARYFSGVRKTLEQAGLQPQLYKDLTDIGEYLTKNGVKTLYIDYDNTTLTEYAWYKGLGFKIKDGSHIIKAQRVIKSDKELEYIRKGCEITRKAFDASLTFIKEGITELQLKKFLEDKFLEFGGQGVAFDTIVAFGANSAVPHHKSGEQKLVKNMPVLIDMGAQYKGYASDFTRTIFFGEPSEKFVKVYQAVLTAIERAEQNIKCAITGNQADAFARNALYGAGYEGKFTHSLGHGVGLQIHEDPRLSIKSQHILQQGMVFTIEPGVYFDGEFGIRTEDTYVLRPNGAQRLYESNRALITL